MFIAQHPRSLLVMEKHTDIGIFGALFLLLAIGWAPVALTLEVLCFFAVPINRLISQTTVSKSTLLSTNYLVAAVIFAPCQIYFLKFVVYGPDSDEFSWWIAALFSGVGAVYFVLRSREAKEKSTSS